MDLLFKRYADPFLLLNTVLKANRFAEFLDELIQIVNDETEEKALWDIYLHKVFDKSYKEFMNEVKIPEEATKPIDFETTIKDSFSILEGFNPE